MEVKEIGKGYRTLAFVGMGFVVISWMMLGACKLSQPPFLSLIGDFLIYTGMFLFCLNHYFEANKVVESSMVDKGESAYKPDGRCFVKVEIDE